MYICMYSVLSRITYVHMQRAVTIEHEQGFFLMMIEVNLVEKGEGCM